VWDMTPEEAEAMLMEWAVVTRDRDNRVRAAVDVGVSKYRVNQLTGIGRSTIDRILAATTPAGAINGPSGGQNEH
jgi:DNA-binding IclR family transcriptional regulator